MSWASLPISPNSQRSAIRSSQSATGSTSAATVSTAAIAGAAGMIAAVVASAANQAMPAAAPRIDTRLTPTAIRRTAAAASPSSGWMIVAAIPAVTAATATARGRADQQSIAHLDEAEQADELGRSATTPMPATRLRASQRMLPPLVDAGPEQRPHEEAAGEHGTEGEGEQHGLAAVAEERERRHLQW